MATNPVDDADLYDSFTLGSMRSPGVIKSMSGHDSPVNWDVKNAKAQSGATVTLKEIPLRKPKVKLYLADREEFDAWADFRKQIDSTVAGKTPKALEGYHPEWAAAGITKVVKSNIGGFEHDGKGGVTVEIEFQEYRPPKPKTGTPKPTPKGPDPDAAALAELEKLTSEYQNTPWTK